MKKNLKVPPVPERLLREIWKRKLFNVESLSSIDGSKIEIISIGHSNPNGGPDFLDAKIKIGENVFIGDVELHRRLSDWQQHTHYKDPKYNKVILHVVLRQDKPEFRSTTQSQRSVTTVVLEPYIQQEKIILLQQIIANEKIENVKRLKCYSLNLNVKTETISNWLHKLAIQRLEYKIRRFEERLVELVQTKNVKEPFAVYKETEFEFAPNDIPIFLPKYTHKDLTELLIWEQLLYEFTMEALGYSKNQQAFLNLSKLA